MRNPLPPGRAGWIKYLLLLVLASGGVIGGLYFAGVWPGGDLPGEPPAAPAADQPLCHHFALSALDAKDQIEAPSLATDSAGRVFVAWASKTAPTERTVFLTQSSD